MGFHTLNNQGRTLRFFWSSCEHARNKGSLTLVLDKSLLPPSKSMGTSIVSKENSALKKKHIFRKLGNPICRNIASAKRRKRRGRGSGRRVGGELPREEAEAKKQEEQEPGKEQREEDRDRDGQFEGERNKISEGRGRSGDT